MEYTTSGEHAHMSKDVIAMMLLGRTPKVSKS